MIDRKFYPASIVDEGVYITEAAAGIPLTFYSLLVLEGQLDSEAVCEALDATLDRYPKFRCVLSRNYPSVKRWFRYCWEYHRDITGADILNDIEDTDLDKDALSHYRHFHSSHRIDVTRHVPVRVLLVRHHKRTVIIFFFHHSVSDGFGCYLFIRKVIQFYEEISGSRKPGNTAVSDFKSISQPKVRAPWRNFSLREGYSYWKTKALMQKESAVQVHTPGGEGSWGTSMAVAREIPPHHIKRLKATAQEYQVTLNDYLLSAMFQAINQWNELHGDRKGRFYINVPENFRSPGDFTIGNISFGFDISATSDSIDNKRELLSRIKEERIFMRKNHAANITLHLTWFLKPLPLTLKSFMFKHHTTAFFPSISLSNLGVCAPNPSHKDEEGFHYIGPSRIDEIVVVNSAIPWPQVVVVTYNGKMTVSLAAFHSHFSLESAEKLLDSFVKKLTE